MSRQGDKIRTRLAKAFPKTQQAAGEVVVADGRVWTKVSAPKPWRPAEGGAVLVGELVGRSTRPGDNGKVYGVATIRDADGGTWTVSGVVITSLFEAAACGIGTAVRIVFKGEYPSAYGRPWRDYDLFLAKEEQA